MRTIKNECYYCDHKKNIPGNYHIRCAKPDPGMRGRSSGIEMGWFNYPHNFDPCWKTKACANFSKNKLEKGT